MTLEVRAAKNSDSNDIKVVVFEVLREYGLTPDPGTTDKDLDAIEEYYHNNHGYFGVVEREGNIVATVGIYKINETTCELRKMYALPSQRGRGLGKYLVKFSLEKARTLGYKRMVLETDTSLFQAIALYKAFGFKEYKPDHLSCRCDQAYQLML